MNVFRDRSGHLWRVAITYGVVCEVRALLGMDLLLPAAGEPPLWMQIESDPAKLCNAVYVCCRVQADAVGVDDYHFGRLLRGRGVLAAAAMAFFESWRDFFPAPKPQTNGRAKKVPDPDTVVWHMAGIVGVHPGPFTLRQLAAMTEGKQRNEWAHTSLLAAPLFNMVRDPKKRSTPFVPADFDPFAVKPEPIPIRLADIKAALELGGKGTF